MTGYEQFQQIMADIEFFKKHDYQNPLNIKDKDGNNIFNDMFGDIFNRKK